MIRFRSTLRLPGRHTALLHCSLLSASLLCGCGGPDRTGETLPDKPGTPPAAASGGTADACAFLTESEIAEAVGNPVLKGQPYAGPEVCKWDTENPDHVSVLLTVRLSGSVRARVLCDELRKTGGEGGRIADLGDVAVWKFSNGGSFSSGDLETCGEEGFLALSLNGKAEEGKLKSATEALARKVRQRQ